VALIGVAANAYGNAVKLVPTGGDLSNALIAIEQGTDDKCAPAVITGIVVYNDYDVDDGTDEADKVPSEKVTDAIGEELAEIATASPAKTTDTAAQVAVLLGTPGVESVTYTNSTALPATIDAPGKALIITGQVASSSVAINVGTLEIAEGATLPTTGGTGTINANTLTNNGTLTASGVITAGTLTNNKTLTASAGITTTGTLTNNDGATIDLNGSGTITGGTVKNDGTIKTKNITASNFVTLVGITNTGTGKVLLEAPVADVNATLNLGTNLEIGTGGSIAFTGSGAAFSGGKTVTISGSGKLNLGANITTFGVTVTNNSTDADAISTGLADANKLTTLLGSNTGTGNKNGTVTATAITVSAGTPTLTVPDNTTLTLSNTPTVTGGTLTLSLTGNGTISGTITNNGGTIDLGTLSSIGPATITNTSGTIRTANKTMLETLLEDVTTGTVEVNGDLEIGTAEVKTPSAILKVASGKTLTVTTALTVQDGASLTFEGTGTLTNKGKIILEGSIEGAGPYDSASTGTFYVSNTNALNSAVAFNVPTINLNADFYTAAESLGAYIAIDARAEDRTADKAITIKGLGKTSEKELTVGILIANDYITLDGVKFNITDRTKGAITDWSSYRAAVSVARSAAADGSALLTGAEMTNKNVTVKNTAITFAVNTGSIGGIFISGSGAGTSPATGITIEQNTVSVSVASGSAAQALAVRNYSPTTVITNNTLAASNTRTAGHLNAPASALYMNIDPRNVTDGNTPNISGNTLNGTFDFYITIRSKGDDVGIPALFNDSFGTEDSVWAASNASDTDSFYKTLFDALRPQTAGTDRYGLIFMNFNGAVGSSSSTQFAIESFEIDSNKVVAVDYWGPAITDDKYEVDDKDINYTNNGGSAGRITLKADGTVDSNSEPFHWTPTIEADTGSGTNINNWPAKTSS
jgi:hypothetical protein